MPKYKNHGMSGTPIYECWHHMKQRCNGTSNRTANKNYHERGIGYAVVELDADGYYRVDNRKIIDGRIV